jgi:DUF1365 family protein
MTVATIKSGIYAGDVVHQRFAPKPHRLKYSIFQVLLDLDHLDDDLKDLRSFSHNRFNLFGLYDRDHGPDQADTTSSLKTRMAAMLSDKGLYSPGDRIFLLAMPRILGFAFNPISLYFIQNTDDVLKAVVYQVNNTFGDRHSYVLPVRDDGRHIHQQATKRLHVSPFMDTRDMAYDFDLTAPEDRFALNIRLTKVSSEKMLFASFVAERRPLSDKTLLSLFAGMPLMTLKVVWGIYWEALLIWLKGMGLKPKPPTPKSSVSF